MASRLRADIVLNRDANGPFLASEGINLSANKSINFLGGSTVITQSGFSGSGTNLTGLNAANISTGIIPPTVLGVGTPSINNYLRGDGTWTATPGANISDDTSTNTTYYPTLSTLTSGSLTSLRVSSPKLTFNPSTGILYTNILNTPSLITPKIFEPITVTASAPAASTSFYVLSQTLYYYTSAATTNWALNVTGDATPTTLDNVIAVGQSLTITIMVTNGATAYLPSSFSIDSTVRTVKWQGGTAPTAGNPNSVDMWTYSIIKTAANTYTVFGSLTKFV